MLILGHLKLYYFQIVAKLDLKQLKKALLKKQRAEKEAKQQANIEQAQAEHEQDLFKSAMTGVTPLAHDKAYHPGDKPLAKRLNHDNFTMDSIEINDPLSDEREVAEVSSEEILSFCRSGIQKNVFKKLRAGQYRISDELDLHGSTLKQAKQLLVYYLQEAVQFEGCCVRIIHGKGHRSAGKKPVLKTYVNHWLSEHERVLAFHSAKPKDGGTGAVYVLLRKV